MIFDSKVFDYIWGIPVVLIVFLPLLLRIIKQKTFTPIFIISEFAMVAGFSLIYIFCVTKIVEFDDKGQIIKKTAFGFPTYSAQDGQNIELSHKNVVINSSDRDLILEPIVYGSYEKHMDVNTYFIPAHSSSIVKHWPDYLPNEEPLKEVQVRGGSSTVRWWLRIDL